MEVPTHKMKLKGSTRSFTSLPVKWAGSALHAECTFHQISPYIGKIKSTIASELVKTFSEAGQTLYDPFAGSGTIGLESWINGRNTIANDLSPYAQLLTLAKLSPPRNLAEALKSLEAIDKQVKSTAKKFDLRGIDSEVKSFFHPETLREINAWTTILALEHEPFLLAALMGILHHQRPGFLSFPSSHTVPYLRTRLFPRNKFPKLYEYRSVRDRLERKLIRCFKRVPKLDRSLFRQLVSEDATSYVPSRKVDAIITSPPYMRQLDYGRDNRLRLSFLGHPDWSELDSIVTPKEDDFLHMMRSCLELWHSFLPKNAWCILILGDSVSKTYKVPLPEAIRQIATQELKAYSCEWKFSDSIPVNRRVRREYRGNITETLVALKNK
jgi:hypothetical protein